jgi:hypothetical protein
VTERDLYAEARALAERMASRGDVATAARIVNTIESGSTSSEILFGLRAELNRLLDRGVVPVRDRVEVVDLRDEINATIG